MASPPSTSSATPAQPETQSYLTSKPTAIAQGNLNIDHPQLRDLLVCKHERGLVSYLRENQIIEQNLLAPGAPTRTVAELSFTPSSLTALALGPNDEDTLYAAGGSWNADLHLSYHRPNTSEGDGSMMVWQRDAKLHGTLNNSVLLTKGNTSAVEPRVGVTNNDRTFRMYDCAVRTNGVRPLENYDVDDQRVRPVLQCVGGLALDTCVNYASVSPSGRTLLTVGDSPNLYIHDISGSSRLSFYPIAVLPLPLPTNTPPHYPPTRPSTFTASFATAFSSDSLHFAVGSQEGVAAIWDIRHVSRPMKVWQVDKMRAMGVGGMGAANGILSWDPSDWFHSRAPAWSLRNIKFIGGDRDDGKEYLVFTEHTSFMHIVNAKTLEVEEIVRIPSKMADPSPPTPPMYTSETPESPLSYIQLGIPPSALSVGPANLAGWDDDDDSEELRYEVEEGRSMDIDDLASSPSLQSLLLGLQDPLAVGYASGAGSSNADFSSNANSRTRTRREARGVWRGLITPPLPLGSDLPSTSTSNRAPRRAGSSSSSQGTLAGNRPTPSKRRSQPRGGGQKYKSIYSHTRNPPYIISDGYAFPYESAEMEYKRDRKSVV